MTALSNIELIDIQKELLRLQEEELGKDKIRACLFNFIVYAPAGESEAYYRKLVKSVVAKFPCRVIFVTSGDPMAEGYLKTRVTAETIGLGESQSFCELIDITVTGTPIERVPYIILPELVPDLPIYLLWAQDPSHESTILPHLEPFAKRIIFDASSATDLQKYSKSILNLTKSFHCDVGDLNWSVLAGWRRLFANVFNTEEMFNKLIDCKTLRIGYNKYKERHCEIRAAYFQAWLAAHSGWSFSSTRRCGETIELTYLHAGKELAVQLIPEEVPSLPPASITQIEIDSNIDKAHFVFKRAPESRTVFTQYSDSHACDLPRATPLAGNIPGSEIVEEIFYATEKSDHYTKMLKTLATIPWER